MNECKTWAYAHDMVGRFATQAESDELLAEYGGVQPNIAPGTRGRCDRRDVHISTGSAKATPSSGKNNGTMNSSSSSSTSTSSSSGGGGTAEHDAKAADNAKAWFKAAPDRERFHDPTRAKPLVVLTWLRINIERMVKKKAVSSTIASSLSLKAVSLSWHSR